MQADRNFSPKYTKPSNEDMLSQSVCFDKKDPSSLFLTLNNQDIMSHRSNVHQQLFSEPQSRYESINSDQIQTRLRSRLSNWRVPCAQDIHSISHWKNLQDKLKDELGIVEKESVTKTALLKDVESVSKQYYETYLRIFSLQSYISHQEQYKLVDDESKAFGNASLYIQDLVRDFQLCPEILGHIIHVQKHKQEKEVLQLTRNIVNSFFENIFLSRQLNVNLMVFMRSIIQFEIRSCPRFDDFNPSAQHTLCQIIISQFCERQESRTYVNYLLKEVLDSIAKNSVRLQVDPEAINHTYEQQMEEQLRKNRNSSMFSTKVMQYRIDSKNLDKQQTAISDRKTEQYISLLKDFDNKIRKDRRPQPQIAPYLLTPDLQSKLGLKEHKAQAMFHSINAMMQHNDDIRIAKNIQSQLEGIVSLPINIDSKKIQLNMLKEIKARVNQNIANLVQLINNFMERLFQNFYNIPVGVRVMCKLIERESHKRFAKLNKNDIYQMVSTFLYDCWIAPHFQLDPVGQIHPLTQNAFEVLKITKQIIMHIIKRIPFEDEDMARFNTLINDYSPSMCHYYDELLSLSTPEVDEIYSFTINQMDQTEQYTSCLSLSDIKTLCKLAIASQNGEVSVVDLFDFDEERMKRIVDRAKRILKVNQSELFLEQQIDNQGEVSTPDQIYVFYYKHQLQQSGNYRELYTRSYIQKDKLSQAKGILRQLLIKINNIEEIFKLTGLANTELLTLFNILQDTYYVHHLNLSHGTEDQLQIQFLFLKQLLQSLPQEYNDNNLHKLFQEMSEECETRMYEFVKTVSQTKAEIVRTLNNLQLLLQRYPFHITGRQTLHLTSIVRQTKLTTIYQALETLEIDFCISSKSSRQLFQSPGQSRKSLTNSDNMVWVENQSTCYHAQFSTEKLKILTNSTNRSGVTRAMLLENYHSSSIKAFLLIFTNLTELTETMLKSNPTQANKDVYGYRVVVIVNVAYIEFMTAVFEFLQRNQSEVFKHGEEQLASEQIEMYITKQIYEKVFQKDPTYLDTAIHLRIRSLDWVTYDHLEIAPCNRVDEMWALAAQKINLMDEFKSAPEKLKCLLTCTKIMNDVLNFTQDEPASADTTVPIMIKILLIAKPKRLQSNLKYHNRINR